MSFLSRKFTANLIFTLKYSKNFIKKLFRTKIPKKSTFKLKNLESRSLHAKKNIKKPKKSQFQNKRRIQPIRTLHI
jgi:hypothetical protein